MMMQVIAEKYDVIKELGHGGTGMVYLVQHRDLKIRYALKLLSQSLCDDQGFITRFKQEAEILSRFSHPGSVQLRDFGKTSEGRYYMTVDYSEGTLLSDLIESEGGFSVVETLDIVKQILSVLDAAHALGIAHRDIKPENIMIEQGADAKRIVKILDFGIAALKERIEMQTGSAEHGGSIGTPEYMSPEQASGEQDLDHRVDIYSTGIVMYELLAGRVPFKADSIVKTLLLHLIQPLEPIDPSHNVPLIIEEIIAKALKKKRDERFSSAAEFDQACLEALRLLDSDSSTELEEESTEPPESTGPDLTPKSAINKEDHIEPKPVAKDVVKILCLDDEEMILNIMRHLLEKEGFEVFTSTSFSNIHDYIFKDKVQLLIVDVQMPGLSGGEICKMIKQTTNDLKIMLFSNIPERDLEKLSQESKSDGWVSKNAKPEDWLLAVSEVLDQ